MNIGSAASGVNTVHVYKKEGVYMGGGCKREKLRYNTDIGETLSQRVYRCACLCEMVLAKVQKAWLVVLYMQIVAKRDYTVLWIICISGHKALQCLLKLT